MKTLKSSKKAISYPVKVLYWNGIPQIRPDGGNEEELFLFLSQFQENTKLNITLSEEDINTIERISYQKGYEQAEKDILSKITKEHIEGLKWIERCVILCSTYDAGITTQPFPYHKYCKELRKILEELLNHD